MKNFDRSKQIKSKHLRHGYFGLGKFISLSRLLQEHLLEIVDVVHNYAKRQKLTRPLNIFIEALPGSGKSFLVKQICKSIEGALGDREFHLLTYNITNMKSTSEINAALRKVQSLNIEGAIPIVFFDEVDSKINGTEDAYPYFLSPMFDGKIYEDGNEFKIGPAVFFFAASKKLSTIEKKTNGKVAAKKRSKGVPEPPTYLKWYKAERKLYEKTLKDWRANAKNYELPKKIIDFMDRIDLTIFIPPTNVKPNSEHPADLKEQAQLFVCAMIIRHFPNIKYVDQQALGLLAAEVMKGESLRTPDSVIFKSSPPADQYFRYINLPIDFRENRVREAEVIKKEVLEIVK